MKKVSQTQYNKLLEKAKFVVSMGSPIKSSREYQKALNAATQDLYRAILNIEHPDMHLVFLMTEEEKEKAMEIAKSVAICSILLD